MKYSVETTKNGYVETLEVNGKEYKKTWCESGYGEKSSDKDFCEQVEQDGFDNEVFLDEVYDEIDVSLFAYNFKDIEQNLYF